MLYKNLSQISKTFHGVTFNPGETKEVSNYINDPKFIRVMSVPEEPPKSAEPEPVVEEVKPKPTRGRPRKITDAKKEDNTNGTDNNQ